MSTSVDLPASRVIMACDAGLAWIKNERTRRKEAKIAKEMMPTWWRRHGRSREAAIAALKGIDEYAHLDFCGWQDEIILFNILKIAKASQGTVNVTANDFSVFAKFYEEINDKL